MPTTPGNTTPRGYRTPALTAAANGPTQITNLADDIDTDVTDLENVPVAAISNGGTQSVAANTVTLVLMDTLDLDKGQINPALPTDRIIIERPGVYRASAMLPWANVGSGASGYRSALIYLNGVTIVGSDQRAAFNGAPIIHSVVGKPFAAVAGDYADLRALHSDTVSRSIAPTNGGPWVSLEWLCP